MKTCTKCGIEKELTEFSKDKQKKDGYRPSCKQCMKKHYADNFKNNKEFKEKNKTKTAEWYSRNKEKIRIERMGKNLSLYDRNIPKCFICGDKIPFDRWVNRQNLTKYCSEECSLIYDKSVVEKQRSIINERNRIRRKQKYVSKKIIKEKECIRCGTLYTTESSSRLYCSDRCRINRYRNKKYTDSSLYKTESLIRGSFNQRLKHALVVKTKSMFKYTGIKYLEYIEYFKNNFPEEFSQITEKGKYHIDHIIPCSLYDFTDEEEIKKCWHPHNLRIIPAKENIIKSNKLCLQLVDKYNIRHLLPKEVK